MTKIEQIKQACRLAIELGDAATEAPWEASDKCDKDQWYVLNHITDEEGAPDTAVVCRMSWPYDEDKHDAAFIAQARTFTPAAARALLASIEALEEIARHEFNGPAKAALTAIEASFPDLP